MKVIIGVAFVIVICIVFIRFRSNVKKPKTLEQLGKDKHVEMVAFVRHQRKIQELRLEEAIEVMRSRILEDREKGITTESDKDNELESLNAYKKAEYDDIQAGMEKTLEELIDEESKTMVKTIKTTQSEFKKFKDEHSK